MTPEERSRRIRRMADSLKVAAESLGFSDVLITEEERHTVSTLALQYAALLYTLVHTDPDPAPREEDDGPVFGGTAEEPTFDPSKTRLYPRRPRRVPTVEEMVAYTNRNDPDAPKA